MKQFSRNNAVYLLGYAALLLMMAGALMALPKADLHLWLNACHRPWLDGLMKAVTYLAQWPIYALMLCFVVRRYGVVAYYLTAELAATALVQILKWTLRMPRPLAYFSSLDLDMQDAFSRITVSGVNLHRYLSFPSGHTQTFFVGATVLALLIGSGAVWQSCKCKRLMQLALLLLAVLGGYSRIYLSQHFMLDVCVGSLIGVAVAVALWPAYLRFEKKWPGGLCYTYFADKKVNQQ